MKKKTTTYRFTEESNNWLTDRAKKQGISKNDIVQLLINQAMEQEKQLNNKSA